MKYLKQDRGFYKSTILLMIPLILQNLITNTMALADTFMVGMLGETELAAITAANTPFFVLTLMTFGIQGGTSILIAQYHGKNDLNTINRVFGIGLYTSAIFTLLVALLAFAFPVQLVSILTNNAELIAPGAQYARIVGFSYFFASVSGIYFAAHRSMENTKLGAIVLSVSGLLNIFLNWILIFGKFGLPAMGIEGAAIATLLSRVAEVLITLVYALRCKRFRLKPQLIFRPGVTMFKDFLRYALPVIGNELLWSVGNSLYTIIMGHMDGSTPILAAYTIAGNLDRLLSAALFAMGNATAIIIGRDIVRLPRDKIYGEAVAMNFIAILTGLVSTGLVLVVRFFFAEQYLFPLMGLSQNAVGYALMMLTLAALILPIRAMTMTNVVGVFRSGGDVIFSLITDIAPMYLISIPLAALCGLVFEWGILAVYLCIMLEEFIKILLCLPRVRSKKWINNVTRDVVA